MNEVVLVYLLLTLNILHNFFMLRSEGRVEIDSQFSFSRLKFAACIYVFASMYNKYYCTNFLNLINKNYLNDL